jgi:hypothetical protein
MRDTYIACGNDDYLRSIVTLSYSRIHHRKSWATKMSLELTRGERTFLNTPFFVVGHFARVAIGTFPVSKVAANLHENMRKI